MKIFKPLKTIRIMKKIILTLALALFTGSVMAQTPEEKAAAKAAKAALKAATKQANSLLSQGLANANQAQTLHQAIQAEKQKGDASNDRLIIENEMQIQTLSVQGIDQITEALATGYINDNKKFEAYRSLDFMSTSVFSCEIEKYQNKEPYNREALGKAIFALAEACHGQLTYGNPKDQMHTALMEAARMKFPNAFSYLAYLCQFCIEEKDLEDAQKALDAYINFPIKYPEMAEHEKVKNPDYPASQFAFNIFYTAFNDKNAELMDKYYEMALQFDNKDSHDFVLRAKPQLLKEQGKIEEWIVATKEMIAAAPNSEVGEIGMQQLMAHFINIDSVSADAYTAELIEKYPENKVANYCRGFVFYSRSDFESAIKFYEKSVEVDPNYADGLYNCGYCYYQNALEKARAISGKKMKPQAAIKEAEAEVKAIFAKAAPYFERYREFETEDPTRWATPLKVIYKNIGEPEKAAEMDAYIEN